MKIAKCKLIGLAFVLRRPLPLGLRSGWAALRHRVTPRRGLRTAIVNEEEVVGNEYRPNSDGVRRGLMPPEHETQVLRRTQ